MTDTTSTRFISPTVRWRYEIQPDWTSQEKARKALGFGTSKDRDIQGYDLEGFDEKGIDRAGYAETAYRNSPSLDRLVYDRGHLILKTASAPVLFRKGLEATEMVLSALRDLWGDGIPVQDLDDEPLDPEECPTSIVRFIDETTGDLSVCVRYTPEEGDDRTISFECRLTSAMEAKNPLDTWNFAVYITDLRDSWNRSEYTDLGDEESVIAMVREACDQFHPYDERYAICVVDGDGGGVLRAYRVDEVTRLDNLDRHGLSGDPVAIHIGRDEVDALENLLSSGKLVSHAMVEMAKSGLFAARVDIERLLPTR